MPITYHCDNCGKDAESMAGWLMVRVALLHDDPDAPPPGTTVLDENQPDRIFDSPGCRTQWLNDHNLGE